MRTRSGRAISGHDRITAENLNEYLPDPVDARIVERMLSEAGFEIGPLVGISMAITGPVSLFVDYFAADVVAQDDGSYAVQTEPECSTHELPLDAVGEYLRSALTAVSFEPAAEPGYGAAEPGKPADSDDVSEREDVPETDELEGSEETGAAW